MSYTVKVSDIQMPLANITCDAYQTITLAKLTSLTTTCILKVLPPHESSLVGSKQLLCQSIVVIPAVRQLSCNHPHALSTR